nr:glycosyltransferase family 1 protein [Rhizobium sp. TCK]
MQQMICVIGTDGSGKTTLSNSVAEKLEQNGIEASRVWLGSESVLMAPARYVLRRLWGKQRKSPASAPPAEKRRSSEEVKLKNNLVERYPWAIGLYVAMTWFDYRLQVAWKLFTHRGTQTIIADRYLFDVAVNLGLTLGWSPEQVVEFVMSRLSAMPLPQVRIFLRVSPEVSLTRKDDIPDAEYLHMRFAYYEAIAKAFGFTELDGTKPISDNTDRLLRIAEEQSRKSYVIYVHANNTDVGGADKVLALMANHMQHYSADLGGTPGFRASVALRLPTPILSSYKQNGIPVILYRFLRPQVSRGVIGIVGSVLAAPRSLWFFLRLFGRERPDLVHVNDLYDCIPALAARLRGIPVVYHIRMIKSGKFLQTFFSRSIDRLADASISVSAAVRDHYFHPPEGLRSRPEVVHDLGNEELVRDQRDPTEPTPRPPSLPQGGRLVLMVGRIEPWKGQHVFIEAVKLLPAALRESASFAIVGGGVDGKEDYHLDIKRAASAAGILMLGTRDDVPALLRAADISVHCSVEPDPFPGVVIESLLAGAATVATSMGGVLEMITDPSIGTLVPPNDPKALADALSDLLSDVTPPRKKYGEIGRNRALSLVDPDVVDTKIAAIYRNLIERPAA